MEEVYFPARFSTRTFANLNVKCKNYKHLQLSWKPCDDGLPTWDCIDLTTRQPESIIHALFNTYYTLHSHTLALSYTITLDLWLHNNL